MKRKMLAALLLSSFWFSTQISSSQAQDWPDPLVELVSISTDTSTFYTDNKLRFNLVINRILGSTYSDITRVWICPVTSWDGFLCNSGQFLVSITPNSSDTSFTIESPTLSLAEGNYLITGVSFRNGAVLSGFTLMYPRSGVVTIGGIATNIPLVNLEQADFSLAQPEPEPSTDSESELITETEPEPEPDTSPEVSSDSSESTIEETPIESEGTTGSEETKETTQITESEVDDSRSSDSPTATESDNETDPANDKVIPSNEVAAESTQPTIPAQPSVEPEIASPQHPTVVVPEVKPEVVTPEVVTPEALPESTPKLFSEVVLPTMQQLNRKTKIGGKVMQVTGEAKLVKRVKAGSGSLRLLATNNSTLKIWLNQQVISELKLAKNQTITWFSRRPGNLKLQLSGDEPELLLDFLKVNGKLIKNPLFQMRS